MVHNKKRQAGFITQFIVPGLLLIGVVLTTMFLVGGPQYQDNQTKAGMDAKTILGQAVTMKMAVDRAMADGLITPNFVGEVNMNATLLTSKILPGSTLPLPPTTAQLSVSPWQVSTGVIRATDAQSPAGDVGTTAGDDVLYLQNLTADICGRINNMLYGSPAYMSTGYAPGGNFVAGSTVSAPAAIIPAAAQATAKEGCVPNAGSTTSFVYYKVIGIH
ncbi:uncharacterized protein NMK_2214 [Novimethylophilus kurashikiensis]|uniref:Uncharacterized protein n=1 Tax=Novimethylophilus kurashikiensis TaxID=1825523 RepID=A0A2R5F9A0_9PROT|nr:hypothetical protein [Novimethylophilus kurashikiensis]GBG14615.1 uncharacterized protein NMK_2214 [Novimethylophilus kurashikiensis]